MTLLGNTHQHRVGNATGVVLDDQILCVSNSSSAPPKLSDTGGGLYGHGATLANATSSTTTGVADTSAGSGCGMGSGCMLLI